MQNEYEKGSTTKKVIKYLIALVLTVCGAIGIAIVLQGLILVVSSGVDRQAEVDCIELVDQSKTFKDFYIVKWQKEMCDSVNIHVEEPVQ